ISIINVLTSEHGVNSSAFHHLLVETIHTAVSELISINSSLSSTGVMSFLGGFPRQNTDRREATDDGNKLRNCTLEEKGHETQGIKNRNESMLLSLDSIKKELNQEFANGTKSEKANFKKILKEGLKNLKL
ncbi:hypothetical protein L9F63_008052, partial [Diploptera punctata]